MNPTVPIELFKDPDFEASLHPPLPVRTPEEEARRDAALQLREQMAKYWLAAPEAPTCGALTSAGTPCKLTVPYRGARCAIHGRPVSPRRTPAQHAREYQLLWESTTADWSTFTCAARTRKGTPCKLTTLYDNGRCKFHGGLSTGPKTPQGRRRSALNGRKGGRPRKHAG